MDSHSPIPPNNNPKPLPRWLWWVSVPLLVGLVILGTLASQQARQTRAIEKVEYLGGRVLMTHTDPNWLRRLMGKRTLPLFQNATVVNLSDTQTTDADLMDLKELRGVERINLSGTEITDAGLEYLTVHRDLKALDLTGTPIQGHGLKALSKLTQLEYLYLTNTEVGDTDWEHLKSLSHLRQLDLIGTNVSPAGVKTIQQDLPDVEVKW
ncbi:MAG: hypothetical protein KDA84_22370 [Planctomycetaceae bacterium]|nr:hypothetical protein [Planctomycetaceae bacterium]